MAPETMNGAYYIIRIREKLDERWSEWFDGMAIETDGCGTLLAGRLPDQAALHGTIAKVHRLGLHLIAVNMGDPPSGGGES